MKRAQAQAEDLQTQIDRGIHVTSETMQSALDSSTGDADKWFHMTVADLADEYIARRIVGRLKNALVIAQRINRNIKQQIGHLRLEVVRPKDIDIVLQAIIARGAPAIGAESRLRRNMRQPAVQ